MIVPCLSASRGMHDNYVKVCVRLACPGRRHQQSSYVITLISYPGSLSLKTIYIQEPNQRRPDNCYIIIIIITLYKCVPLTTAWRVLRLRMEERLPIRRIAANILNKQSRTADKGWFSSFGAEINSCFGKCRNFCFQCR